MKEYSIDIYEWSGTSWEPYVADDVQVQFYMMSPYVLKTLSTDQKVFLSLPSLDVIILRPHILKIDFCGRVIILHHLKFQTFMGFSSSRLSTIGLDTLVYLYQSR